VAQKARPPKISALAETNWATPKTKGPGSEVDTQAKGAEG
jgi:hypothetical protein